jgi:hypothetical protein
MDSQKEIIGVWNTQTLEERVTQAPSVTSTKAHMEINSHVALLVNDTMTMK